MILVSDCCGARVHVAGDTTRARDEIEAVNAQIAAAGGCVHWTVLLAGNPGGGTQR